MVMDAANKLSAIAVEMGQMQNQIQERHRVLNLFLRSVRTLDPALKEAHIRDARECIEDLFGGEAACATGGAASTHRAGCHPRAPGILEYSVDFF
ncbi:hypothetical protein V6N13_065594 [Hibiscus sabdariffa]|uniref:Uncharacterized protein n=1 Tax=Hibiscus sabdariffa TaxID=183260 RepID=A0ABR2QQJ1_9ROSI